MADRHADAAIDAFSSLEERFAAFLKVVPYETDHTRVHSPVLVSLYLDVCSLLESILKSSMDNPRYNNVTAIAQHRARRYSTNPPFLNISDLRAVFRADMFYAKRVWFLQTGDPSFPWYTWRRQTDNPRWWTHYNDVKHNRFDNGHRASLETIMHAMKATFLALIQSLDYRERLVERGVIRCAVLTTNQLRPIAHQWEPLATPEVVLAMTSLFGYRFLSNGFPHQAKDGSAFL